MKRRTKIIATLGPAVASRRRIADMVRAGMDVARLNFSHGSHETHRRFIDWVRRAAEEQGRAVAVLQDVQGPRIRVGLFPAGRVEVRSGSDVVLRPGSGTAAPGEIYIDELTAAIALSPGDRVLVADGFVRLEVRSVDGGKVRARVVEGGVVGDHKGVAFPDNAIDLPAVTDKDRRDLEFGYEHEVDFVAASFVSSGEDVAMVRKLAGGAPVIAKIERAIGYAALDNILEQADGAMVARGDLGVEMSLQRLPLVQKDIIMRSNAAGRFTITATEMLESMTHSPRPTRAEVTDVANAVLDGTDAVMLSGETAMGKFPIRAVEVMDKVCREIEADSRRWMHRVAFLEHEAAFPSAVARACVEAADSLDLPAVVAFTESGNTARLLSKYRPEAPIVAFAARPATYRQMAMYWGVTPLQMDRLESTDAMFATAERLLMERGIVEAGDGVAIVAGVPPNQRSSTNLLKLHIVGSGSPAPSG